MGLGMPSISVMIRGVDMFSSVFSKAGKQSESLNSKMQKTGGAMTRAVTLPVIAGTAAIFKQSLGFDKYMNMVKFKSAVGKKSIAELREEALRLGGSTRYTHAQVAEGMNYLSQAGFDTGEVFAAINPTLSLATATSSGLGETADWLSNILKGFGEEADQAGVYAAVLAETSAKSNVNLQQIAKSFEKGAPLAKKYGLSVQELATYTGILGNAGIQGTRASTVLLNMLVRLAAPPAKAAKAMKSLGIETADAAGNMRKPQELLKEIFEQLKDGGNKKAFAAYDTIFGKRAEVGVMVLSDALQKADGSFDKLFGTLQKAGVKNLAEKVSISREGVIGPWYDLVSAFSLLGQSIGDSGLLQAMTKLVTILTSALRAASKLSPALTALFTTITLGAATAGPALWTLGKSFSMLAVPLKNMWFYLSYFADFLATSGLGGVVTWASGVASSFTAALSSIASFAAGMVAALLPFSAALAMIITMFQVIEGHSNVKKNEADIAYYNSSELAKNELREKVNKNPELYKKYYGGSPMTEAEVAAVRKDAGVYGKTGDNILNDKGTSSVIKKQLEFIKTRDRNRLLKSGYGAFDGYTSDDWLSGDKTQKMTSMGFTRANTDVQAPKTAWEIARDTEELRRRENPALQAEYDKQRNEASIAEQNQLVVTIQTEDGMYAGAKVSSASPNIDTSQAFTMPTHLGSTKAKSRF